MPNCSEDSIFDQPLKKVSFKKKHYTHKIDFEKH